MKKLFLLPLAIAVFLFACNSSETTEGDSETMEETHDDMHSDDDGHIHDDGDHMEGDSHMHDDMGAMSDTTYEYTAAYVCPMHCEGSGSDEPGSCPVCGMDYVANE